MADKTPIVRETIITVPADRRCTDWSLLPPVPPGYRQVKYDEQFTAVPGKTVARVVDEEITGGPLAGSGAGVLEAVIRSFADQCRGIADPASMFPPNAPPPTGPKFPPGTVVTLTPDYRTQIRYPDSPESAPPPPMTPGFLRHVVPTVAGGAAVHQTWDLQELPRPVPRSGGADDGDGEIMTIAIK